MASEVAISVDNRWTRFVSEYPYDDFIPYWSFSVPGYRFMSSKFKGWDGRIKLLKRDRVPTGLFLATRKEIQEKLGVRFRIEENFCYPDFRKKIQFKSDKAHDYQNQCLQKMLKYSRSGGGLILSATGSGKTRTAGLYFAQLKGYGLFVVDQLDLLEQAKKEIQSFLGEKVGYVGKSIFKPRRITVATVQTLHLHRKDPRFQPWLQKIQASIIDEIHVQLNRSNFDVVADIRPLAVFGLTATLQLKKKPIRLKAWSLCGPVIFEFPLKEGQKRGILSQGIAARVLYENPDPYSPTGSKNGSAYGEAKRGSSQLKREKFLFRPHRNRYTYQYNEQIVDNVERNAIISNLARRFWKKNKHVIILVERIQHLKNLSQRLKDIPHKLVWGGVDVSDRQKYVRKMESSTLRLIIANKVFKKGVNIKRVDVIIDAAAGKSQDDAVQKFGRGIRKHDQKAGLIYIDIADHDPEADWIKKENKRIRKLNLIRKKQGKNPIPVIKSNRFHRAALERTKAFKKAGIPVYDIDWNDNAKEICKQTTKLLLKEIEKDGKRRHSSSQAN